MAEPKGYMKIYNNYNNVPLFGGLIPLFGPSPLFRNDLCRKCGKFNADYKLIRPNY